MGRKHAQPGRSIRARAVGTETVRRRPREGEESFSGSDQALPDIVEEAPIGVYRSTREGRFLAANAAFAKILGYESVEQVLSVPVREVYFDPEERGRLVEREAPVGRINGLELRLRRKDGSAVWVELDARAIHDADGREILEGFIHEIGERKAAEEKLRTSEEHFRTLIENASDIIVVLGSAGEIRYISPSTERILGVRLDEVVGRRFFEFVHPEDLPRAMAKLEERLANPEVPLPSEFRVRHPDGSWRVLQTRGTVVEDPSAGQVLVLNARDVTEQKAMEEALRESEGSHRKLFDLAPVGIYQSLPDGRILKANARLAEMLGYDSPEELSGRNLARDIYVEPAERQRLIDSCGEPGIAGDVEVQWKRKNGEPIWIQVTSHTVQDDSGRILRFEGFVRDISEHKTAEESLRLHALVFENIHDAVVVTDVRGAIIGWNPAAEWTYGYKKEEVLGKWPAFLSPRPDSDALAREMFETALSKGRWSGETLFVRKDGFQGINECLVVPLRDQSGQVVGTLAANRDVSERKRMEKELHESEERYRSIVEASPLPMLVYDPASFSILSVNRAAVELYGYSRDEFLAMAVPQLRPPEEAGQVAALHARALPERWHPGVVKHRRKDGTPIDVDIYSHEVVLAGRSVRLAVLQDVTEQRSLQEQLQLSQKMEAVGRLAGGVAHDFNNILTAILGYADIVLGQLPEGPGLREDILEIRKAGERAADLTRRLLAFSRKQILAPREINLNETVSGMGGMLRRVIGEDVRLVTALDPSLDIVRADPGQIEQVIMNLAVNARDAMPDGGDLRIETLNVAFDEDYSSSHFGLVPVGRYVLIAVSDTGVGMDAATQARIFEPFFTTKEKGKGTGLGLAMVYGIVKQSGGFIWVYSEPGLGTTFKVYLPRVESTDAPRAPAVQSVEQRGSETILLVEDDAGIRVLARRVLEQRGYRVAAAATPAAALGLPEATLSAVDLLLTDVVMPEISGRKLADTLQERHPRIKVLFMSGYTDSAIVDKGILEAGVSFLQKPFTPDALARKVRETLEQER
jgi:two-component system, cell cycle sensor histidine kinase and response regulator CckA